MEGEGRAGGWRGWGRGRVPESTDDGPSAFASYRPKVPMKFVVKLNASFSGRGRGGGGGNGERGSESTMDHQILLCTREICVQFLVKLNTSFFNTGRGGGGGGGGAGGAG